MTPPPPQPDIATSIGIASIWMAAGSVIGVCYALFILLMCSGGVTTPDDHRILSIGMSLTLTPLVLIFGWVPVVRARHRGLNSGHVKRLAGYMVIAGLGMIVLNTIFLPISFMF